MNYDFVLLKKNCYHLMFSTLFEWYILFNYLIRGNLEIQFNSMNSKNRELPLLRVHQKLLKQRPLDYLQSFCDHFLRFF